MNNDFDQRRRHRQYTWRCRISFYRYFVSIYYLDILPAFRHCHKTKN